MTVREAVAEIRTVGTVQAESGKLKLRFPEPERARLAPAIEVLRQNRPAALDSIGGTPDIPPAKAWPESLRKLADEHAAASGNPEGAKREVWTSWYEWKARELNRPFLEQGVTRQSGRITAETVRHGIAKAIKNEQSPHEQRRG